MKLQEVIGAQWGEMSVMNQYLFQGWNCRGPAKYRDMLLDIATEEIGHVEMLATMVAHLLEGANAQTQEAAAKGSSAVHAILGGSSPKDMLLNAVMNPQHIIASGQGAMPADSVGNRWTAAYITASGNLLADFRLNVTTESQGRLQVARLYHMTDDSGIRDMLSFLLARDTMHQNQCLAAIEELRADGLEDAPCPSNFPQSDEATQFSYQYLNFSEGTESAEGRWARGVAPDGKVNLNTWRSLKLTEKFQCWRAKRILCSTERRLLRFLRQMPDFDEQSETRAPCERSRVNWQLPCGAIARKCESGEVPRKVDMSPHTNQKPGEAQRTTEGQFRLSHAGADC